MGPIWFINEKPDFEREQWTLMAYMRDAQLALSESKISPYYFDIKKKVQDLECFISTRTVISKLTRSEKKRITVFNSLPSDNADVKEVNQITAWAIDKLRDIQSGFNNIWRKLESSFNLYYIGPKPADKVKRGYLLIRYAGSHVTEVYAFKNNNGIAEVELAEYTDDDYPNIKERLSLQDDVFIVAESNTAFNTGDTAMPYLVKLLEGKIF